MTTAPTVIARSPVNVPDVTARRCSFCSHWKPRFLVHQLQSNQTICENCLAWHCHAIEFLRGGCMPRGCQACGAPWDSLRDSTVGVEVRMYVVPKDGIYQLLCAACVRPYTRKRSDLYGGTEYGKALKI